MQSLSVTIKNCYGIRDLEAEFCFQKNRANIVYAPNGMMKTSFAKTLKDYSQKLESRDRIYTDREPTRVIKDHTDTDVDPEEIFVIEPYDSAYESSRISTLLVGKELKDEYDNILKDIDEKSGELTKSLQLPSGVKKGLDDALSTVFMEQKDLFLKALERIRTEVSEGAQTNLSEINYASIFNPKVEKLLLNKEFRENLVEYTNTYDSILSKSHYFRKGIFNHYQAEEIAKQLKNHGFFKAEHAIYLTSDGQRKEITTEEELEETIKKEMQSILSDEQLRSSFDKIDSKLKANVELRSFREFLLQHQEIIPELANPALLKQKLWVAYLIKHRDAYLSLMTAYDGGKKRIEEITDKASEQATKWQEVINIFNRRFSVPFKVAIENKQDVILKRVTPNISFQFFDEDENGVLIEREKLVDVLSNGEKRALYILNIIFEVEARKEQKISTLFVIDDIADSFDYKNKYAIVEYLNDILLEGDFRQIILTHNYDFYRTVWKRLSLSGSNFHITKSAHKLRLEDERMYKDPFDRWKNSAETPNKASMMVALIPFVRNIADYCGFEDEYTLLTSLLHVKANTNQITKKILVEAFTKVLNGHEFVGVTDLDSPVLDVIFYEADRISALDELDSELETKITLSIAVRLKAEQFLISRIQDDDFVAGIRSNQTAKLIKRYKDTFYTDVSQIENIKLMERVNLMTPENIHLNSFMYEPILDMSPEHLANLYLEVSAVPA